MFSSQWFLTLFTAKFPLSLVYHVLDWFLMEGPNVIYRISLAMLRTWRRDLLALDFEGNVLMKVTDNTATITDCYQQYIRQSDRYHCNTLAI